MLMGAKNLQTAIPSDEKYENSKKSFVKISLNWWGGRKLILKRLKKLLGRNGKLNLKHFLGS